MKFVKGICLTLLVATVIGGFWWLYLLDSDVVNRGSSRELSFNTSSGERMNDYPNRMDASPLIKAIACEPMRHDGTRACTVELSTSNHDYYLHQSWTNSPNGLSKSISLTLPDQGGIPVEFKYNVNIKPVYGGRFSDSGSRHGTDEYLDHFSIDVDVNDIKVDPESMPIDGVLTPLRQSLRNVSNAVMATADAKAFIADVDKVVAAHANLNSYR